MAGRRLRHWACAMDLRSDSPRFSGSGFRVQGVRVFVLCSGFLGLGLSRFKVYIGVGIQGLRVLGSGFNERPEVHVYVFCTLTSLGLRALGFRLEGCSLRV